MGSIAASSVIHPSVTLGKNVVIEDFCIIGLPCAAAGDEATVIGDNAVIRAGTYIYAGNRIGANFQTGNKVNIRECNDIGDNVSIGTQTVVEHHVRIGNGARIHSQAFVPEFTVLEEDCWIGPNVVITNARYPKHPDAKKALKGPVVARNAKVGANVTILPGISVGEGSLIGAGSVVTKDVPAETIVAGSPARAIGKVDY
ncbi:MAG: transferase [Alphaproteobacteria bacterium]|nr:transferase [Alphaproteobacteria bacterium]